MTLIHLWARETTCFKTFLQFREVYWHPKILDAGSLMETNSPGISQTLLGLLVHLKLCKFPFVSRNCTGEVIHNFLLPKMKLTSIPLLCTLFEQTAGQKFPFWPSSFKSEKPHQSKWTVSCSRESRCTIPPSSSAFLWTRRHSHTKQSVGMFFSNLGNNQLTGTLPDLTGMDLLNYV